MHHKRPGNERILLNQIRGKNMPRKIVTQKVNYLSQGEIIRFSSFKNKSKMMTGLYQSVADEMFYFYGALENNVDDVYHTAGMYCPTANGIYMPASMGVITLEHETAHFLEMSNLKRLTYSDMGMPFHFSQKSDDIYLAAFTRELRVRQIQRILMNEEHCHDPVKDIRDVMRNSFWRMPSDAKKFKGDTVACEAWAIDLANKTRKLWTEEKIRFEFKRRTDYMLDWMHTANNHKQKIAA